MQFGYPWKKSGGCQRRRPVLELPFLYAVEEPRLSGSEASLLQWRIRAPFVFNISSPVATTSKQTVKANPLQHSSSRQMLPLVTRNLACLFHLSHLIAPSAITGWLSWELGSEKASREQEVHKGELLEKWAKGKIGP